MPSANRYSHFRLRSSLAFSSNEGMLVSSQASSPSMVSASISRLRRAQAFQILLRTSPTDEFETQAAISHRIAIRSGGILSRAHLMASRLARSRDMPTAMPPRTTCTSCLENRVGISGAWAGINVTFEIQFDSGSRQRYDVGGGQQLRLLPVGQIDFAIILQIAQQAADCFNQFLPHFNFVPVLCSSLACPASGRPAVSVEFDPYQDEPVSHHRHHGVMGIPKPWSPLRSR